MQQVPKMPRNLALLQDKERISALTLTATQLALQASQLGAMTPEDVIFLGLEMAALCITSGRFDPGQAEIVATSYFTERLTSLSGSLAGLDHIRRSRCPMCNKLRDPACNVINCPNQQAGS